MDVKVVVVRVSNGRAGKARTSSKRHRKRCLREPQG
jgi:hypothetical protein